MLSTPPVSIFRCLFHTGTCICVRFETQDGLSHLHITRVVAVCTVVVRGRSVAVPNSDSITPVFLSLLYSYLVIIVFSVLVREYSG